MEVTKYNVDKNIAKRTYDGIVFDSVLEMKYYIEIVCPGVESGKISYYELQKEYILQPDFIRQGKKVRPITYVADFYIEYADGHTEIIDTKGMPDNVAKMKRKMFWCKYPDLDYRWVTYVKKYGGWIDYDVAKKLRSEEKKKRKALEKEKEEKELEQNGKKE